jgi:WD40 repeat protein
MRKKTRTFLFWVCAILFLAAAPSIILYSQGYRVDFSPAGGGKIVTQTGGLFLKVLPKQTEIYVNGELEDKTDFFFGSVLIDNLFPGKYEVEVRKDKFFSWQKTLEVKEKEVAEAKNVFLFPQELSWNVLSKGTESFWLFPDENKIILKETSTTTATWALKLFDLDKNLKSQLINETSISRKGADLLDVEFSGSTNILSLKTAIDEQIKYYSLDISKATPLLTAQKTATTSVDIIVQKKIGNDLYELNKKGYLLKNGNEINSQPLAIKQETAYSLEVFGDYVFLKEDRTLFELDQETKSFTQLPFESVNSVKLSPDGKKMLVVSDHEIWVLFLQDESTQPQRKTGDKILLTRLSDRIENCFWLNYAYLAIFDSGKKLRISEIDDRPSTNVIEIKSPAQDSAGNAQIFWSKTNKNFYLLVDGTFYGSGVLLSD